MKGVGFLAQCTPSFSAEKLGLLPRKLLARPCPGHCTCDTRFFCVLQQVMKIILAGAQFVNKSFLQLRTPAEVPRFALLGLQGPPNATTTPV